MATTETKKYHVILSEAQVALIENAIGNDLHNLEDPQRVEGEMLQGMFNDLLVDPLNEATEVINNFTL